jgi:malignant T-cell-amplified sequence
MTKMFKNFDPQADISGTAPAKSSAQRAMLQKIAQQYPNLSEEVLEAVLPKKQQLNLVKCKDHITLVMSPVLNEPVFFQIREGPFYPTLKFLHRAGDFMPKLGIDKGGIKFVLKGADVFAAGITSKGGSIPESLPVETPVQIMGEEKELPMAIGITKQSTDEMKASNSGVGVTTLHYIGDDLWKVSNWK